MKSELRARDFHRCRERQLLEPPRPTPVPTHLELPDNYVALMATDYATHNQDVRYALPIHGSEPYSSARAQLAATASEVPSLVGWWAHSDLVHLHRQRVLHEPTVPFEERFSEEQRARMQRGQLNEPCARLSFCHYMRVIRPGIRICQTGLWKGLFDGRMIGATPDDVGGSLDNPTFCVEYKVPAVLTSLVPSYYIPQVMLQMYVTRCRTSYFVQWTPAGCQVFTVPFQQRVLDCFLPLFRYFLDEQCLRCRSVSHLQQLKQVCKEVATSLDPPVRIDALTLAR